MLEPILTRVLVVDDHAIARQVILNVLHALPGVEAETAASGNEARDKLYTAADTGKRFDVVFLDWNIPDVEGIDLLKHFRLDKSFNTTAFIMVTSESDQSLVLGAIKSGANAYIIKPTNEEIIKKKFLEAIDWVKKQKAKAHNTKFG